METNSVDDPSNEIDFAKVPITELRQRTRSLLSRSLNPVKVLPSEEGFPRDWRGVAHLAGLQSLYGPVINTEKDPMAVVLSLWCTEGDNQTANFDNLVKFLGVIDRWDVADDISEALLEDAKAYKSKAYRMQLVEARQDAANPKVPDLVVDLNPDYNILTKDDLVRSQKGLPPQQYDAFVLFAEEDIEFATELVERMEVDHPRFGFKLCLKDRDLIGGIPFEHDAILSLIAERCNRLILIVSSAFLKSPANKFFVNFAQALQIEQRRRRIVPCIYEKNCILPKNLKFYFLLRYNQTSKLFNFWEKLSDSIRSTDAIPNGHAVREPVTPSIQITEITDEPNQQAAIAAAPTPTTHTAPVKVPRKKGTKVPAADTMKVHSMPGPKIRNAFSMIQLNAQQTTPTDGHSSGHSLSANNCDINQSETNLSQISTTKSSQSTKAKWYKKLLMSSSSANSKANASVTTSNESLSKPKSKRSWLKKRLTSSTS